MKSILIISQNTFKEIFRDRVFYGCLFFSATMFLLSFALGQLSFQEQSRISINFSFTAIHITTAFLSLFVGSSLISREIHNKTGFTILTRPVSRSVFLFAKAIGLFQVVLAFNLVFFLALLGATFFLGVAFHVSFLVAFVGILLESMVLISLAVFLGTFSRPALASTLATSIFFVAHWKSALAAVKEKSTPVVIDWVSQVFLVLIPDLEKLNWRSLFLYEEYLDGYVFFNTFLYSLFWCTLYLCLAQVVFLKRPIN